MTITRDQLKELLGGMLDEKLAEMRSTNYLGGLAGSGDAPAPKKGEGTARLVRALVAGKGDPERAARFARKNWGDDGVAKALESGADAAGGFIVPPNYSQEIIELLYPQAVVRNMGATTMPMNNGTLEVPKLVGGVQAEYVGENQNISVDQPDFGQLLLSWKKLACIVPISNDLIRDSSPAADAVVRDDLVTSMALREDRAFIRDDGTGQKPTGMRFQPGINLIPADDITGMTDVDRIRNARSVLGEAKLSLENSNARMIRPGWIIPPRVVMYLQNLTDGNGNQPFRQELNEGNLEGLPYRRSNQIPTNLSVTFGATTTTDATEVFLADFADTVIGEATDLIIDTSQEAAYFDGAAVQAAFSRDQTLVRAIARHDFGLRHNQSVAVITGVRWGSPGL